MIIPDYHSVSVYAIRACEGRSLQKSSAKTSSHCYERQRLVPDFSVFIFSNFDNFKVKRKFFERRWLVMKLTLVEHKKGVLKVSHL